MNKFLNINFGSITDNGKVKEFNTDAVSEFKILNGHVFVVCDGHDGVEGHGALASKLIAESIKKYFYNRSYKDMSKALTNAITYANFTLFEQTRKNEKYRGIGSTLAIVIYRDGKLYYAYAGDSRIYVFKNNQLQPLTRDHVDDAAKGAEAEVKILLGKSKDIKFGVCKNPLAAAENDIYLVCTDGLTDQLTEVEITEVLADADKSPEHKCQNLIEMAKEKGGTDCVSVQVLDFSQVHELPNKKAKVNFKPILFGLIGLVALAAVGYGGYKAFEAIKGKKSEKQVVNEIKGVESDVPLNIEKNRAPKKEVLADNKPKVEKTVKQTPQKAVKNKKTDSKTNKDKKKTVAGNVYYKHKVKYGENLYRIAIRYNTTQKKLININGKKATNLIAGSFIKIPVKAIHTVKKGESFSTISDKYNVKIKIICTATKIAENAPLKEGQTLIIPL